MGRARHLPTFHLDMVSTLSCEGRREAHGRQTRSGREYTYCTEGKMMRIVPFGEALLDEAATLLAARQRENRRAEAALPARFEEPAAARAALAAIWSAADASGVAAWREDRKST